MKISSCKYTPHTPHIPYTPQISSTLPSEHVYGIGEHVVPLHLWNNFTTYVQWASDHATPVRSKECKECQE